MSKSIGYIFGGEGKVKIMRLFLFNGNHCFRHREVAKRSKEKPNTVRRELNRLSKAGLIKPKTRGFTLNETYPYLAALEHFLIDAAPISEKEILRKLGRIGSLKLVLLSGVFIHDPESRIDLLVVGDRLKKNLLETAIASIEAELGREIRYSAFETAEFKYRLGVYDKLVRDILDFSHKKILNKLAI